MTQLETHLIDETLIVSLSGDWTIDSSLAQFSQLFEDTPHREGVRAVAFDTVRLGDWDSSLLAFIVEGLEFCETHRLEFKADTLPENIAGLVSLSQAVPEVDLIQQEEQSGMLLYLGRKGLRLLNDGKAFLGFTGAFAQTFMGFLTRRVRLRWRDFWVIVQSNSSGALPIVTLISFLVGLILSFLGAVVLRRFGADYYVSYLVSYGVLRELGALMTAIIMAGRTGAAFAAELGSMKISEEIDALETLGISPMEFLVLPRFLGIFVTMPLLTIYANFIGVIGGMLVAIAMLDVSIAQFINGFLEPVSLVDALLGLFKATVFGAIIGLAGSIRGLQTGKGAGAVGTSTTSAVVTGHHSYYSCKRNKSIGSLPLLRYRTPYVFGRSCNRNQGSDDGLRVVRRDARFELYRSSWRNFCHYGR